MMADLDEENPTILTKKITDNIYKYNENYNKYKKLTIDTWKLVEYLQKNNLINSFFHIKDTIPESHPSGEIDLRALEITDAILNHKMIVYVKDDQPGKYTEKEEKRPSPIEAFTRINLSSSRLLKGDYTFNKKTTFLDLSNNLLDGLKFLETPLVNLVELILHDNNLSDLKSLTNCLALQRLVLSKNKITCISQLSTLTKLEHLDLSYNQIKTFKPLNDMPIKSLKLNNNISIGPWTLIIPESLPQLETLDISNCGKPNLPQTFEGVDFVRETLLDRYPKLQVLTTEPSKVARPTDNPTDQQS